MFVDVQRRKNDVNTNDAPRDYRRKSLSAINLVSGRSAHGGASVVVGGILRLSTSEVSDPGLAYPTKPYNVSKKQYRGLCLVINQRNFDRSTGQSQRDGTDADADRVHRVFRALGYCVSCYLNVNRERFMQLLKESTSTFLRSFVNNFRFDILSRPFYNHASFWITILNNIAELEILVAYRILENKMHDELLVIFVF
ncbi:hypothetical protein FGIG_12498 [Fasciola gigantica]|uniref:Caspase family p20 domain-containing protein n=1 Tax=Fasciola gigantica TaxID=46835 RepID=A0A504Y9R2_FASGI|nr:hypothetical protein FGIG_12498 [Fasciola gigantica]